MHTIPLKSTDLYTLVPPYALVPPFPRFPKIERIALWTIISVFAVSGILCLYVIGIVFFSDVASHAQRTALAAKVGPATEQFIQELKTSGLYPVSLQKIVRTPFSVSGRVIALYGDNVQVFEYPNQDIALKEASLLAGKYADNASASQWRNSVHLYTKNTLTIFYMGNDKNILDALDKNAGLSLVEPGMLLTDKNWL